MIEQISGRPAGTFGLRAGGLRRRGHRGGHHADIEADIDDAKSWLVGE